MRILAIELGLLQSATSVSVAVKKTKPKTETRGIVD
jgi:hypothetical protein